MVRRGGTKVPRLGIKQQLVLDYDLWSTTERLQEALHSTIHWEWVRGHQTQGRGSKWNLDIAINSFCDRQAEKVRVKYSTVRNDPFYPDQQIGIKWEGERLHGSPRTAINTATHDKNLQDYICEKERWTPRIFTSVDWRGLEAYLGSLPATAQTNVIKLTHNWVHDGYQKDLFAQDGDRHPCPAECGRLEAHQHYLSCYAPPMTTAKAKCMQDMKKIWKKTRTATPIRRALQYILSCVMHETEPLPRRFSSTPINIMIFKAWQEQKRIGWGQLFRGRLSSKWRHAQELYYQDNPDTRGAKFYSGKQWAKLVVGKLIGISLHLWDTRNKVLHGTTVQEQNQIQRIRVIQVVTQKHREGLKQVRRKFPSLYMEPCIQLRDKPTIQLVKWIETYNACMGSIRKEDIKNRRKYAATIKQAYKRKGALSRYRQILLFHSPKSNLLQKHTGYLKKWVELYNKVVSQGQHVDNSHQEPLTSPTGRLYTPTYLRDMIFCMECNREQHQGGAALQRAPNEESKGILD